jgi:hypothetical protein
MSEQFSRRPSAPPLTPDTPPPTSFKREPDPWRPFGLNPYLVWGAVLVLAAILFGAEEYLYRKSQEEAKRSWFRITHPEERYAP